VARVAALHAGAFHLTASTRVRIAARSRSRYVVYDARARAGLGFVNWCWWRDVAMGGILPYAFSAKFAFERAALVATHARTYHLTSLAPAGHAPTGRPFLCADNPANTFMEGDGCYVA